MIQRPRTIPSGTFASGSKPGAITEAETKAMVWVGGLVRKPVAATAPPAAISIR